VYEGVLLIVSQNRRLRAAERRVMRRTFAS